MINYYSFAYSKVHPAFTKYSQQELGDQGWTEHSPRLQGQTDEETP